MPILNKRAEWSSKWVFVLAVIGVTTGLGNVWKLPYVISENGGAAFVYAYLLSMVLVILPILMVEIVIGRHAQTNPLTAIFDLGNQLKASKFWRIIGCLALLVGIVILAYLSVAGGWSVFYIIQSISNGFAGTPGEMIQGEFGVLLSNPKQLIIWLTVFMLCAVGIVARGIKQGVETAVRFLVPAMLLLLLAMLIYCYNTMDLAATYELMFNFELAKLTTEGVVNAFVYALFTTGLAAGVIMMYSSYLPKETAVAGISIVIVLANILLVLAISLIICALVFNYDAEFAAAPSMIYQTLPVVFVDMPKGMIFASGFFTLIFIASLIAAVALLEPIISWLTERFKLERKRTSWCVGGFVWLLGIVVALSQNIWAFEFDFLAIERNKGIADIVSIISNNVMLPLGALMMVVFASKKSTKAFFREELALSPKSKTLKLPFKIWRFIIRFVCFIALAIVFLYLMFGALFTYNECMVTFQLPDMTIRFELCNH